jgi:hypothetical protein
MISIVFCFLAILIFGMAEMLGPRAHLWFTDCMYMLSVAAVALGVLFLVN